MERLRDLAYDLWWSWSPLATRLFTWIDPDHWRRYHNPVQLLINVEPHHWQRLLGDPEFRRTFDSVIQALDEYRTRPRWFDAHAAKFPGPIGYFSMEFGIHESLGRLLRRPGSAVGGPLQGGQRPGRAPGGRGPAVPLRVLPPDRGRRRLPAAHLSRLRLRPPPRAARGGAVGRRAHGARRPARAGRAGGGLEGAGREGRGAHAGHRHPLERPRGPADHRHPLRAGPRDAPVPGDHPRRGRRAGPAGPGHRPRGVAPQRGPRGVPQPGAGPGARAPGGRTRRRPQVPLGERGLHHPHPGPRGQRDVRPRAGPQVPGAVDAGGGLRRRGRAQPRHGGGQLQPHRAGHPPLVQRQRGEPAPRPGLLEHVAASVAGRSREPGGPHHQRRAHGELDRAGDARALRPLHPPAVGAAPAGARACGSACPRSPTRTCGPPTAPRRSGSSASCGSGCASRARATASPRTRCGRWRRSSTPAP